MPPKTHPIEIDFRPMTVYRGRKCGNQPKRWSASLDGAVAQLRKELADMGVKDAIVETRHDRDAYTLSGRPRTGEKPARPEIQVWFKIGDRPTCIPSNNYTDWISNIKAVAMTLERQRLIRDYGCFSIEEQFAAFTALPPGTGQAAVGDSAQIAARLLLNLAAPTDYTEKQVCTDRNVLETVFRKASKKAHPDTGGSVELMSAANAANATLSGLMK